MYRYGKRSSFNAVMKSNRYKPFLYILILALSVFLIVKLVGSSGLSQGKFETQRDNKLRSEMQHAVAQTNSLSRLGGSSTSLALGKIRQYIHGMEIINDLNVGIYGESGRMFEQSVFDTIYSILDEYDAKLQSGQKTSDTQSLLMDYVTQLSESTYAAIGGA